MEKIKVGDVVQLSKRGTMVVRSIKYRKIVCDWFDDNNKLHRKTFKKDEIFKIELKKCSVKPGHCFLSLCYFAFPRLK